MYKKVLALFALASFLVAGMLVSSPAAAFSGGVTGSLIDGNGLPWEHGFEVYLVDPSFNVLGSQVVPAGTHTFATPFTDAATIPNGTLVTVYILPNDPPGDWPAPFVPLRTFNKLSFIPGAFALGNISTQTGPLAVTLSGFDTTPAFNTTYAIAALFLVLGGASLFVLRRQTVQA